MIPVPARCALLALLTIGLFTGLGPSAQAGGGLTVAPTMVEMSVEEGEQAERTVKVSNSGSDTIRVQVYAMDFSAGEDGELAFSGPGHGSYSAAEWLSPDTTDFELAPGGSRQVAVTVAVPEEVEPGGHYAALFFQTASSQSGEGVGIAARIPSLFYITVPGVTDSDVLVDAEIDSLVLPRVVQDAPVPVSVVVRNTGNVHLTVAARAFFYCSSGRTDEVDMGQVTVLPGCDGRLEETLEDVPFIGRVEATVVTGYFDRYGGLTNESRTETFYVIPWKQLLAIAGVLVLFITLALVFYKTYGSRPG